MIRLGNFVIYKDSVLPEFIDVPNMAHAEKPWMKGRSYHKRIQKKWLKRYGFQTQRNVIWFGNSLFAHPGTVSWLMRIAPGDSKYPLNCCFRSV